ncbi:MAG: putative thiamine biosynthesis protein ThiS [Sphaerisporangium sp.]|jgi:sulfur carrier protein|nr:putative thiamine biosynthesis protein ThiS [Sphaerisporangium sp.]
MNEGGTGLLPWPPVRDTRPGNAMKVTINGAPHDLPPGSTVAQAVQELTSAVAGVAVALNDEVVRRGAWQSTTLGENDRVEVLTAVQGG